MSNKVIALMIISIFVFGATLIGLRPGMKEKLDLEGWAIGGRSFGRWLNWFVCAGEIYTAFVFLGACGWAYTKGGPAFYIMAYMSLAYLVSYFVLPSVSKVGKKHNLLTQPDFMAWRYNSKAFGILTAIIGVVFLLPYLELQLTGLGIIIQAASYNAISRAMAMVIAFILVALFVYVSGLKGVASTAVVKDILMALAVIFFGIYLPVHYFGSIPKMLHAVSIAKPGFLTLPGGTPNLGIGWYITTVLLTSLGFYMWPHIFADSYSAKSPEVLQHNAVWLPLYSLTIIFPLLVGFTAMLVIPGLKTGDMAFLSIVAKTFPAWMLGLIGGAGALTCMVPAADLLLGSSMLLSRNVYQSIFSKEISNEDLNKAARTIVLALTVISLLLAVFAPNMLVNLLLIGYAGITQFFPVIVLGLYWHKATKYGAFAGVITGEILVAFLLLNKMDPIFGLSAGFVALVCNTIIYVIVSLLTSNADEMDAIKDIREDVANL